MYKFELRNTNQASKDRIHCLAFLHRIFSLMDSRFVSDYTPIPNLASFNEREACFSEEILGIFNNCCEATNPYLHYEPTQVFNPQTQSLHPQEHFYDYCHFLETPSKRQSPWLQTPLMEEEYISNKNPSVPYDGFLYGDDVQGFWHLPGIGFQGSIPSFSGEVAQKPAAVLSAQSVAARIRRKKISEKTRELGKLIPGGTRMNTAEMLQEASKYVIFLQAQLSLLEFMASNDSTLVKEELGILCSSPNIQEKLYDEGKCIASTQFVKSLIQEPMLHENHDLHRDLKCLVQSLEF
ncbi:transcription factor bHLH53 [Amborella trichopoda]|uniref:BHLH domain-containing protein n=1 Tax=Amborella trichopoda TaxID=13333 RepID=W1NG05_AMBTC|nr:transcription factor bHLH53 [Amborella trichopoda]ERM94702.1 hypothetical protein AMTR_s00011p00235740 [Amborella trichopoda]|eukprot:XP_006878557.1 transcription factor bHLH53 [Amborella trichopoda]